MCSPFQPFTFSLCGRDLQFAGDFLEDYWCRTCYLVEDSIIPPSAHNQQARGKALTAPHMFTASMHGKHACRIQVRDNVAISINQMHQYKIWCEVFHWVYEIRIYCSGATSFQSSVNLVIFNHSATSELKT